MEMKLIKRWPLCACGIPILFIIAAFVAHELKLTDRQLDEQTQIHSWKCLNVLLSKFAKLHTN